MNNGDMPAMAQNNGETLCQQTGTPNPMHMGLTKREYFAGLAMQGYISSLEKNMSEYSKEHIASHCCSIADALLAELEK